jgi:hypothetical protein
MQVVRCGNRCGIDQICIQHGAIIPEHAYNMASPGLLRGIRIYVNQCDKLQPVILEGTLDVVSGHSGYTDDTIAQLAHTYLRNCSAGLTGYLRDSLSRHMPVKPIRPLALVKLP